MTGVAYRPQYRRIEPTLRERIAGLRPGQRLPSDAELQAEFAVSRMTARNAMQRLADEGLVAREPGRGSFVAEPSAHRRSDRLMTFTREMRRRGLTPSSRLLARGTRPATALEAAALGLLAGATVVHLRRLRCASVLTSACADAVMEADLEHGSLHETLSRAGFRLRRGTGTIGAAAASGEDARLLIVAVGSSLLVEQRVIADSQGRRIEATESRYPADRYALHVRFDVEEVDAP